MVARVKAARSTAHVRAAPTVPFHRPKPPTVGTLGVARKGGMAQRFKDQGLPKLPKPAWRVLPPGMPLMERVTSSNVYAYGYDPVLRLLYVQFRRDRNPVRALPGWVYRYHEIPGPLWQAFRKAKSKGKFVWRRLRWERGNAWGYDRWTGQAWRPASALAGDRLARRKQREKARKVYRALQGKRRRK